MQLLKIVYSFDVVLCPNYVCCSSGVLWYTWSLLAAVLLFRQSFCYDVVLQLAKLVQLELLEILFIVLCLNYVIEP